MAPLRRKRQRTYDPDEVRSMLMNDVQPRADSDSEESLAESESESSDDEFGPTRRDAREGGNGTHDGGDAYQNDSDSEVDEDDEEDQPQEQPDQWIDLGDNDWTPTWQNSAYRDQPVDYFTKFFPDDVFELMARQTNLYARQTIGRLGVLQQHSRLRKWSDTSATEMKAFTALQIAMGLVTKPAV